VTTTTVLQVPNDSTNLAHEKWRLFVNLYALNQLVKWKSP